MVLGWSENNDVEDVNDDKEENIDGDSRKSPREISTKGGLPRKVMPLTVTN